MSNPITDFIKFLYNDLKTDYEFVRDVLNGKRQIRKLTYHEIQELKDWKGVLKENWLFFLIVISAFCAGYFFASVQLNNMCSNVLTEWFNANSAVLIKDGLDQPFIESFNLTMN